MTIKKAWAKAWAWTKKHSKTFWNKVWTGLWGSLQLLGAAFLAIFQYIGEVVNDPTVKSAVSSVDLPGWVLLGIAVFGAITLTSMAHGDD